MTTTSSLVDSGGATSVASDAALAPRAQATCPSTHRDVPAHWDQRQREQIAEIAQRVKAEHCASYTLVCLGIQAHARDARAPTAHAPTAHAPTAHAQ
tara:strand:+ start:439 stop:729 length:291 start_codon:yes stop_codon:yes gene_type:complete